MRGIDLNISRNIVIIDLINHNAVCKTAPATLMSTESAIRAFQLNMIRVTIIKLTEPLKLGTLYLEK